MSIVLPSDIAPFRLKRRVERLKPRQFRRDKRIISVEKSGTEAARCISVDSPYKTYLTDDLIVTHNTSLCAALSIVSSIRRTVVVTYDIGKWNWMRDVTDPKWDPEQKVISKLNFTILDRTRKRSMEAFDERFVIINYDSLEAFLDKIGDGPPVGHIILSEAQRVKNWQSRKHKVVAKLISMYPEARITFESGTPIMNRLNDLFAYFRLAGHPLGTSYKDFSNMFLTTEKVRGARGNNIKVTGAKNTKLLELCMSNFMIRKTQEECTDIPNHSFTNLYVSLDEWGPAYRQEMEHAIHAENRAVFESYIHSINRITALAKLGGMIEHTEALIEAEEKVVILVLYNDVATRLKEHFGDRAITVTGKDGANKLDNAIRFMEDPTCMVAIVNMVAGGHTIDLSISSHVIVSSFPLSPKTLEQSLDRVKNLAKKRVSNVYYYICNTEEPGEVSIDERLLALNHGKDTDINAILDGGEYANFQQGVVEKLRSELMESYGTPTTKTE